MTALGAAQAWPSSAEAALPLGWHASGRYRFDGTWIGLAEEPPSKTTRAGPRIYAEQALRRLSDRLRARRGPTTG